MDQLLHFISSHPYLIIALLVVIFLIIIEEGKGSLKGLQKLSPQDAVKLINNSDAKVVDVRSNADFKKGHIVNSTNILGSELKNSTKRITKYKNKPLIIVCANSNDSIKVGAQLKEQGFSQIHILAGGIAAWQRSELPLTKT